MKSCEYSKNGKVSDKDPLMGVVRENRLPFVLSYVMSNCLDFKEEKSDLEHICAEISSTMPNKTNILFTPKFHCELAGEGIEYAWGASKRKYRGISFARKTTVSAFRELVNDCVTLINVPMMKKILQRQGDIC